MNTTINQFPASTRTKNSLMRLFAITIGIVVAAIILSTNRLMAQETDTVKTSNAQISFGYPLGSNGIESINYRNKYSFNFLYGANGGVDVAEIGGYVNYNKGSVNGFQLSGLANITTEQSKGAIISGVANFTQDNTTGALVSGILNYSGGVSKGFHLSTANITNAEFSGLQVGVYNHARKLKGVQLGVINFVDSLDNGVPIGLINIVRHGGYFALEVTGGETLYGNFNYKMGVEKFYTIFKGGYTKFNEKHVYSYGFGFGTKLRVVQKHSVSIDLSMNAIIYDDNWEDSEQNILNKADFNYQYSLTDKLSVNVGPSFNVYRTEVKVGDTFGTLDTPNEIYTDENDDRKISMWIGFNAGISLRL